MARRILMGALLSTLVLGTMTAGVRAGDDQRSPASGRDLAAAADRADLGGHDLAAKGCQTLKCINRTLKALVRALNGICVLPVTQYGNGLNDNSGPGYMWDDDVDGPGADQEYNTTALDVTEPNTPVGALMLVDCP